MIKILKYLVAVTFDLNTFAILNGILLSCSRPKKIIKYADIIGFILGLMIFLYRLSDPRGTNLFLMSFNRWLLVVVAGVSIIAVIIFLLNNKKISLWPLSLLIILSLMSITPPILQYTREFVYFGESGISSNAMLRALGFFLGLVTCFLISLSAFEVHQALKSEKHKFIFALISIIIFSLEYISSAISALQRLKIIPLSDLVFDLMIWRGENPNAFIFAQIILCVVMLIFVIFTHLKPAGNFANNALLRKEKAKLRNSRRWSWSLLIWCAASIFIIVVLHYYDTKPPAEVEPESYTLENNIISIPLEQVGDGHLHKFLFKSPGGFDVKFLVVKKPIGTSYGLGLDCCEICGVAGYFERGDEIVCRRCDVVMNKNTIGFKGGCNPIPFEYSIKNKIIYIDVQELIKHERRFK